MPKKPTLDLPADLLNAITDRAVADGVSPHALIELLLRRGLAASRRADAQRASPAFKAAAQQNAKKGGWPKGRKRKPEPPPG